MRLSGLGLRDCFRLGKSRYCTSPRDSIFRPLTGKSLGVFGTDTHRRSRRSDSVRFPCMTTVSQSVDTVQSLEMWRRLTRTEYGGVCRFVLTYLLIVEFRPSFLHKVTLSISIGVQKEYIMYLHFVWKSFCLKNRRREPFKGIDPSHHSSDEPGHRDLQRSQLWLDWKELRNTRIVKSPIFNGDSRTQTDLRRRWHTGSDSIKRKDPE